MSRKTWFYVQASWEWAENFCEAVREQLAVMSISSLEKQKFHQYDSLIFSNFNLTFSHLVSNKIIQTHDSDTAWLFMIDAFIEADWRKQEENKSFLMNHIDSPLFSRFFLDLNFTHPCTYQANTFISRKSDMNGGRNECMDPWNQHKKKRTGRADRDRIDASRTS